MPGSRDTRLNPPDWINDELLSWSRNSGLWSEVALIRCTTDRPDARRLIRLLESPPRFGWRTRAVAAWAVGELDLSSDDRRLAARLLGNIVADRSLGIGRQG